jgi:glycosyltransferase involved in cell wall biosynthesis
MREAMARKPVVIIGHPEHFAPRLLAAFWRTLGMDVAIVTRSWDGPAQLPDGTRILQSLSAESAERRDQLNALHGTWERLERDITREEYRRYTEAMGPPEHRDYHPSLADSFIKAMSIPPFVDELDPAFVLGQEVFSYGLATALCSSRPRVLMPWGGDVFRFADTSSVAFAMVRRALQGVDLIVPGAKAGADHIVNRFDVPSHRVSVNRWGFDRTLFRRASDEQRRAFCAASGIDPASLIIVNIRRFKPRWGNDLALEAFLRLAAENPRLAFFAIGGGGSEPFAAEARARIAAEGFEGRIRILDGHVPDETIQQLVSVTDIFTSLVRRNDMGSRSIKEGASTGATPVLSNIASAREMESLGFRGFFVDELSASGVTATLRRAIEAPPALRAEIAAANQRYLDVHEDRQAHLLDMLDRIAECRPNVRVVPGATDTLAVIHEILAERTAPTTV